MDGTASVSGCATQQRSSAPVFRFSSADHAPHDRLDAWRQGVGRGVHLRLDVEPVGDAPPRATVELHRWASASLYFGETTPVRASRTRALVQDGDGDFRLVRSEGAGFQFTAQGVDETVEDGCALCCSTARSERCIFGPCHHRDPPAPRRFRGSHATDDHRRRVGSRPAGAAPASTAAPMAARGWPDAKPTLCPRRNY